MPISPLASATTLRSSAAPRPRPPAVLTAREQTILVLVVEGLTNRQIAEQLTISPRTVQSHLCALLRKLEVQTRTGLAVAALRTGLVPLEPFELVPPSVPLAA